MNVTEEWNNSPEKIWAAMPAALCNNPWVKKLYLSADSKQKELDKAYELWAKERTENKVPNEQ